jgi:AcrR family transcriptional regulator
LQARQACPAISPGIFPLSTGTTVEKSLTLKTRRYRRKDQSLRRYVMDDKVDSKRDAIINAALELIAERGFHQSPTSLIANMARVGIGTIYRYFKNKDVLIEEVFNTIWNKYLSITAVEKELDKAPLREQFIIINKTILTYFVKNSNEFKFLEQYFNSPYGLDKIRSEGFNENDPTQIILKLAKEQQIIKDLPVDLLSLISYAPIPFLARDHVGGFLTLNEDMIHSIAVACWDAIKI